MYISKNILKCNLLEKNIIYRNNKVNIRENEEVCIFGCGTLGKNILKNSLKSKIRVKCFIDNSEYKNYSYNGVRIYNIEEFIKVYNGELIIVASIIFDKEMEEELINNNIINFIPYYYLCEYNINRFPAFDKIYGNYTNDLLRNRDKYINMFDEIEDELSLKVLDNILMFRITMDRKYILNAYNLSKCEEGQYFDNNILKLSSKEVFIDGGAYKGETTEQFLHIVHNKYKQIDIFEPDDDLYKEVKKRVKGKNINFHLAGLGNRKGVLRFNKTGDTGGCINENGVNKIQVETIDNILKSVPATFIKLDIEGAELEAIYGARNNIINFSPKMVISSYHKSEDLWKLFYEVKKLNSNYSIYIRHYSKSITDTDFYYIP